MNFYKYEKIEKILMIKVGVQVFVNYKFTKFYVVLRYYLIFFYV